MKSASKLIVLLLTTVFICSCSSGTNSSNEPSASSDGTSLVSSSSKEASSKNSSSSFINELENNPKTCDNHEVEESIRRKATIIERGIKRKTCPHCGGFTESYYYDLDELDFSDTTYLYDGNEREITISGLIPLGCSVKYENNKLKEKGSQDATAKIYDPDGHIIGTKTAKLSIIDNIGLPNIKVTTLDGDDPDWHTQSDGSRLYEDMTVTVDNCDNAYKQNDIPGQIKVRGNSTNQESVGKRAFRFKFSAKTNLLGLNDGLKEKSWVLLADFFDQSRFRNEVAFIMGDALFNHTDNLYCSDYKHVNLYMNGEDRGVYLLAEQQQAKPNRIPINEAAEDYTGTDIGYLVEIDGLVSQQGHIDRNTGLGVLEGDPCFNVDAGGVRVNNSNIQSKGYVIKTDTFADEQRQFIRKYMNSVTKAFASTCNNDLQVVDANGDMKKSTFTTQYETLNSFLDIDSFFRMYLLQEYLKDYDVGWGSFYMYVDFSSTGKVKRLTMSAPWDFDLGEGDKQSGGGWGGWPGGGQQQSTSDKDIPNTGISSTKDDFISNSEYANGMTTSNPMLYLLSQTNFFKDMFKKYYAVFNGSGIMEKVFHEIAYERVAFANAFNLNHTNYALNVPNNAFSMQTRRYDTHKDAVDYLVKWLGERKTYLDSKYLK